MAVFGEHKPGPKREVEDEDENEDEDDLNPDGG
jgi:hypothetical protein